MFFSQFSQLNIGTTNLEASLALYAKLGFRVVARNEEPNPWAQITDDSLFIFLNQDGLKYVSYAYFMPDIAPKVAEYKAAGLSFFLDLPQQAIVEGPEGALVTLISNEVEPQAKRFNFGNIPQEDWMNPDAYPNKRLGFFGELAYPVKDMQVAIDFWNAIGFTTHSVNEEPYPWAILTDGLGNIVGAHQTTEFTAPGITYFAKEMGERIKALKEDGVENIAVFKGTGGNDSNVVLTTPEEQTLFLFSF